MPDGRADFSAKWALNRPACSGIDWKGMPKMMTPADRELALNRMEEAVSRFYGAAVRIGNHPFIEFAGVMTAYLKSCQRAHDAGIEFSECNRHAGRELPMEGFEVDYLVEKLDCIFGGRITAVT